MTEKRDLTAEELAAKCLANLAEEEMPKPFRPFCWLFDIPGTKNEAEFRVVKDAINKELFRLEVHAQREGSSLTMYHIHEAKTEEELREDMRRIASSPEGIRKLLAEIMELSARVDDKEGEFPSDY